MLIKFNLSQHNQIENIYVQKLLQFYCSIYFVLSHAKLHHYISDLSVTNALKSSNKM